MKAMKEGIKKVRCLTVVDFEALNDMMMPCESKKGMRDKKLYVKRNTEYKLSL